MKATFWTHKNTPYIALIGELCGVYVLWGILEKY